MFNYETKNTYKLIIKAEDNGVPKRSSTVVVNIFVKNIDEPLIIHGPLTVKIPENYGTIKDVIKVTATDPDNAAITYQILGTSLFVIDASSGAIKLAGAVDREATVYVYKLTVEATAGTHTVSTTVTITVTDINDNTPTFKAPKYTASINENTNVLVGPTPEISATDLDATAPNNVFSYSISDGNTNDAFKIDSVSIISSFTCFSNAVPYKERRLFIVTITRHMNITQFLNVFLHL